MSKRVIGAVGAATAVGLTAIVITGAVIDGGTGAAHWVRLRNAVYAALAAAILLVVLTDAVHHRLTARVDDEPPTTTAPSWLRHDAPLALELSVDGHASDLLLPELHLAARLGAELMGERPHQRQAQRRSTTTLPTE